MVDQEIDPLRSQGVTLYTVPAPGGPHDMYQARLGIYKFHKHK